MKRATLTLIVIVLLGSIAWVPDGEVPLVPTWYYSSPCYKPPHLTFYDWLPSVNLGLYNIGMNDCSNRSAYVEWLAENCGYTTQFAARWGRPSHVWLLVSIGGEQIAFETSYGSYWVTEVTYYSYDLLVNDVGGWLDLWPGETGWFVSEWVWW